MTGSRRRRARKGEATALYKTLVDHSDPHDCVDWPFHLWPTGYARLSSGKATHGTMMVTRMLLIDTVGPPPAPEHQAAHSCHRPVCVNPHHLRWATVAQNQRDRFANGTSNRGGERSGMAKLTPKQVRAIRSDSRPAKQIAADFGVAAGTIHNIISGRAWRHVR